MKILFWAFAIALLLLAVAFAAANAGPVTLRMWPFSYELVVPVFAAIGGAFLVGVIVAALYAWIGGFGSRLEHRRLVRRERALADETTQLRARLAEAEDHLAQPPLPDDGRRRRMIVSDSE